MPAPVQAVEIMSEGARRRRSRDPAGRSARSTERDRLMQGERPGRPGVALTPV